MVHVKGTFIIEADYPPLSWKSNPAQIGGHSPARLWFSNVRYFYASINNHFPFVHMLFLSIWRLDKTTENV